MIQRIKQIWTTPAVRSMLIICAVGLLLSACGGESVTFNKDEWTTDFNNCFPCIVYEATFAALEKMLGSLIRVSCQMGMTVLGLGLLFWLAFKAVSLFSLKEPNIREFVHQIAVTLFKAIIIAALIYDPDQYLHFIGYYIIQPIFMFFSELSRNIMLSNSTVAQNLITPQDITGVSLNQDMTTLFGDATGRLLDIIYRIFVALYMGVGLGLTILQQTGFISLVFGLLILTIFFILLLMFPITFLDAFVQIAAILVLSPFVFISWIFPATKGIIGKVWNILFGAMFNIMFGCIYIALMTYIILVFAERTYPGILGSARQTLDPMLEVGIKTGSTDFLGFFILILSMAMLSGVIPKLAQNFTGANIQAGGIIKSAIQGANVAYKAGKTAALLGASTVLPGSTSAILGAHLTNEAGKTATRLGLSAGKAIKDKITSR